MEQFQVETFMDPQLSTQEKFCILDSQAEHRNFHRIYIHFVTTLMTFPKKVEYLLRLPGL